MKKEREETELRQKIGAAYSSRRGEIVFQDIEGRFVKIAHNGMLKVGKRGTEKEVFVRPGEDYVYAIKTKPTKPGGEGQLLPDGYVEYGKYAKLYCTKNVAEFLKGFDIC